MFTCISCRIAFDAAEEQRSHFGTDWHRYNMKRRVANLPPVSATAFNEKVMERREQNAVRPDPKDMACSACKLSGADFFSLTGQQVVLYGELVQVPCAIKKASGSSSRLGSGIC